jgi:hypothetical protein
VFRPLLFAASLLLLASCDAFYPYGRHEDPEAEATVRDTSTLVAECRHRFEAVIAGRAARFENGPSIERDGDFTRVTLEAQPSDPDARHPYRFECRFENGALSAATLQP